MKKVLILICYLAFSFNFLNADTLKQINLVDFASIVSNNSDVNIIINDELNTDKYTFTTSRSFDSFNLKEFEKLLTFKDLKLVKFKNYYFIDYKNVEIDNKQKVRVIKLKNNSFDVAVKIIEMFNQTYSKRTNQPQQRQQQKIQTQSTRHDEKNYFSNLNHQVNNDFTDISNVRYIETTNSIIFTCDDEVYNIIKQEILKADKDLEQVTFKITITETNTSKLKQVGSRFGSHLKLTDHKDFKSFLNIFLAGSSTNIINSDSFYSILDLLEQNGLTEIRATPFLVAKNNKKVEFINATNIPFLTAQSEVSSSTNSTTSSYSYKDVGLKIYLTPHILQDKVIFDLELVVEDVLNTSSQTPSTSKKYIKSTYTIKKDEILLIGGINKEITFKTRAGVPILKDIPLLKYLFGWEKDNKENQSLLISIELI